MGTRLICRRAVLDAADNHRYDYRQYHNNGECVDDRVKVLLKDIAIAERLRTVFVGGAVAGLGVVGTARYTLGGHYVLKLGIGTVCGDIPLRCIRQRVAFAIDKGARLLTIYCKTTCCRATKCNPSKRIKAFGGGCSSMGAHRQHCTQGKR